MKIEAEKARLKALRTAPLTAWHVDRGVLLSDRIEFYCKHYDLITPFNSEDLRPAAYDLRVGDYYSVAGGGSVELQPGDEITIPPYQVAIIQIRETLNLPLFIIGRWNIRVKHAYKGLLWVGGAQVDPGWRGKLCCPIYNLSSKPVRLRHGDPLASIDFVVTTEFHPKQSREFDWTTKWLLFENYPPLNSGVAEHIDSLRKELDKSSGETKRTIDETQKRIDTFVSLVFVVVSVLFTGLGVVATKGGAETSILSSPIWVAAIALYFALKSYSVVHGSDTADVSTPTATNSKSRFLPQITSVNFQIAFGLALAVAVVIFHLVRVNTSSHELQTARQNAQSALSATQGLKADFDKKLQAMESEYNRRLAETETQLRELQNRPNREH